MDRKSIIILVLSFILLIAWYPLVYKFLGIEPARNVPSTNQISSVTNQTGTPPSESSSATQQTAIRPKPQQSSTAPHLPLPEGAQQEEQTVMLENEEISLILTSHGGGLKEVRLKHYPQEVTCGRSKEVAPTNYVRLNRHANVPALSLLGPPELQGNGVFQLQRNGSKVVATKELTNGLRVVKSFTIESNFLLNASVRLENAGTTEIRLPAHQYTLGTASPLTPSDDPNLLGLFWYDGEDAEHIGAGWFANRTLGCIPGTPRQEYVGGSNNVVWGAVHNQFFTMVVIPDQVAAGVAAWKLTMPAPPDFLSPEDKSRSQRLDAYQTAFLYPEEVLAAGETIERHYKVYTGPKEYNTLARLGASMENELDLIMEFDGFFGFFAKLLLLSMNGIHALGLAYGYSIIAITVVIKLLFWPLTRASTRSMKRMAALQPEMKAIQEKYKEDPQKMNKKLMEFMKENKVNPMGGCLPMLLQIPVFLGFFTMLRTAIELRGAQFLWACDLSRSDTVAEIPGLGFPINPMPLLMGATMLFQARMTPPSPGMDPVQQKIMRYMPLMFMVFLYNFSAGLTLYWTVQNLLTIAQMKMTKNADDAAAKGGPAKPGKPLPQGSTPAPAPGPAWKGKGSKKKNRK